MELQPCQDGISGWENEGRTCLSLQASRDGSLHGEVIDGFGISLLAHIDPARCGTENTRSVPQPCSRMSHESARLLAWKMDHCRQASGHNHEFSEVIQTYLFSIFMGTASNHQRNAKLSSEHR